MQSGDEAILEEHRKMDGSLENAYLCQG